MSEALDEIVCISKKFHDCFYLIEIYYPGAKAFEILSPLFMKKNNPSKWKRKIMDAMEMDFSWDAECCDIHVSAYTAIKKL